MDILARLNSAQYEAVTTTEGFVRVIAGAGSGKTRALSHRFAFLVNELGILPGNILCVTFTNKAAHEMRQRIHALTGDNDTSYINTFHGFCVSVLQEDSYAVQYPKRFLVLDNSDIDTMLQIIYEERSADSNAFRWYLGIDLNERVPNHSTISQLRRRKLAFRKVFRQLFVEVVRQYVEKGLVSGRLAVTDSTHVKANASRNSEYLVEIQEQAGNYWELLDAYEEEGLEELARRTGKRQAKRTKQIKKDNRRSHKRVSRTDPEAGYMTRPGKPNGFYYLSHQTTDPDCGIITAVTVTPGDVHDSRPYLEQLAYVHKNVVPLQAAAADSAYDLPLAHQVLDELGIDFYVVPQPAYDRTKAELKRDAFTYDGQQDVYRCPNGKQLRPKRLYRSDSGLFWEYWADRRDCGIWRSCRSV